MNFESLFSSLTYSVVMQIIVSCHFAANQELNPQSLDGKQLYALTVIYVNKPPFQYTAKEFIAY